MMNITAVHASGSYVYGTGWGGGLYVSTNGGASYVNRTTANGLCTDQAIGVFTTGTTVYVATQNCLSISTDSGTTFNNITTPVMMGQIYDVEKVGSTIYVGTLWNGIAVSNDNGITWTNRTTAHGLVSDSIQGGVTLDGTTLYVATAFGGISISTDGGNTFVNKTMADGLPHNIIRKVRVSGGTVYAPTASGLSMSSNSWATCTNRLAGENLTDVFVDGLNVYAPAFGSGLHISTDGGTSFTARTTANGLGSNNVLGVYASGANIYAATLGGLSISTDGGASFINRTTANGLGSNSVNKVNVINSVIYASTFDGGLSYSTDGGATFSTITNLNGLGSNSVYRVFLDGTNLYIATYAGLMLRQSWTP